MSEIINNDYLNDLQKIKDTIKENRNKAMVVVNSAMIMTYYEIGTIINERKTWGSKYIESLANDLKEYVGFSLENLKRMARIAVEFSIDEIRSQPVTQIPWSTLTTVIMAKSSSHKEMLWYINETHKNGWSRAMVMNQIEMKAYERNLIEPTSSISIKSDDSLNEIFKDTYVFDFLDKNKIKTEKDLKNQMIDNIIKFLQELGPGFSLVGKGYSYNNLKYMSQVAKEFSFNEISQQLVGQIPWGTLVTVIMPKSYSHEEMLWYINETHKNGWSRSMVLNQIALKSYERSLIEPNTTSIVKSDDLANELFKDTYIFSFLDKNNIKNENDLKNK